MLKTTDQFLYFALFAKSLKKSSTVIVWTLLLKKNILYKFQSGFQKFHSIDFCLSYLQDKVANGRDSGLLTEMILIDLQKAFDTIDQKILIEKMKCTDFYNDATKWFEYYLSKRMFNVQVENSFFDKALIICGVPNDLF